MTDPVSGQIASQAMEQLQSTEAVPGVTPGESASDFAQALHSGGEATSQADASKPIDPVAPTQQVAAMDRVDEVGGIPTEDFVQRLLHEESEIQKMMERSLTGGAMGQEEMLQMQAVIYSYSQRVELASKVVDNATGGIKQVMNTQV